MKERRPTGMGRGTVVLLISHGVFLLSGCIIHFGLGRYLGPGDYGIFGVVLALMTTMNLVLTSGFPRGVAKYIAEDHRALPAIARKALVIQGAAALLAFGLYFGLSGVLANSLFGDPELTKYIRVSALVIPASAVYALYQGYLNGVRSFSRQAIASVLSSVAKVAAVFLLVWWGLSVSGAIFGYLIAAAVGALLCWRFLGPLGQRTTDFAASKLLSFGIPATIHSVMMLLIMNTGLYAAKALGQGAAEVGYYTAASTIARVSYTLFVALAATLLPSISRSIADNNPAATRGYIRDSLRYMLMLLIPGTVLMVATAPELLTLTYSAKYVDAAAPLAVLAFALGLLAVFMVLNSVIMGSGKPQVALGMSLPLMVVCIILNLVLIPSYGLMGAAWATFAVSCLGACAGSAYVLARFRALVDPKAVVRICAAAAVIYVVAAIIPTPGPWLPLVYVGLFGLYFGLLGVTRELGRKDVEVLRRMMPTTVSEEQ